jgi:hypothetical protein
LAVSIIIPIFAAPKLNLMHNNMSNIESNKGEIVMYQPDETIRLEVRVESETVWLTQQQMAELFQTTKQNVSLHVNNIFREDELTESSVVKESLTTAKDGKRYKTKMYNLDVIISVGYRVKSKRGTKFRQWANRVLKEYIIRGYVLNQQLRMLEERMENKFQDYDSKLKEIQGKVNFFVRSSLPPIEGIFYDGQIFDAYVHIVNLIKQAKQSIVLIDNYIDETTLTMLSKRSSNVSATIYTSQHVQNLHQFQLDIQRHNQQYPPIVVNYCQRNHDRFLIIDDVVYVFGASLKDAGKKLFAYIRMQETSASELLNNIR